MKAIRRSLKSDKEQPHRPPHLSLPQKSPTAIIPPKKVIKALYDYEPQNKNGQELAFHKGDFFHVLSRENDTEWYEACNPLVPSARGLVPVAFFQVIGQTQRQSGQSTSSDHDSGYSEPNTAGSIPINSQHSRSESASTAKQGHMRGLSMMSGKGGSGGAMVYGVVQYDFVAERADELDAKAGEAIIVVAQSNPEWFVAKPIGRLGGPGLIPVSFVDIKDTATMKSVEDPLDAVRKAGVPRVEEWKKFTAEYKNGSISLGKFQVGDAAGQKQSQQQVTDSMGRLSLQQGQNSQRSPYPQSLKSPPPNQHQSIKSSAPNSVQHPSMSSSQSHPSAGGLLAVVSASVPRYCFDNDMYWYIIECQMEDGRWYELSRYYADFYDLQIALIEAFPEEAGQTGGKRVLPYMPGPVQHVTDAISNGRRENLDNYIKQIIAMPPYISKCNLVRKLFQVKPGQDYEIDPNALAEDYRLSQGSQQSLQRMTSNQSQDQMLSQQTSRQSANQQGGYGGMGPIGYQQQQQQQQQQQRQRQQQNGPGRNSQQGGGPNGGPPYLQNQPSNLTTASSTTSLQNMANGPRSATQNQGVGPLGAAMKIKVFFQDDIIAIRVPQDITFLALKEKLLERLKVNEDISIRWRNESGGSGDYVEMRDDEGLEDAVRGMPQGRIAVVVGLVGG